MHFSNLIPTLGGLVAVAQASPHLLGLGVDADVSLGGKGAAGAGVDAGVSVGGNGAAGVGLDVGLNLGSTKDTVADLPKATDSLKAIKQSNTNGAATCPLAHSWEDRTLFNGVAAPASASSPAIKLGLNLPKAQIQGDATLELVKDFLQEPRVRVGLGGVKAYVEVDISASAAVHESIELFASPALDLEIPGLLEAEAGAALALDLVVGVDAAVDLSAGVYLAFGEEAFVEISLLTKDIVEVSLEGLVTKALPLGIAADVDLAAAVNLQLGLRLRTEIDLEAELEIPVLDIEAGAKIAVWVSLFEYTAALVATDNCAVSVDEVIALTLGLAVDLNVEVGDILELNLAPTLTVELATAAKAKVCMPNRGSPGIFLEQKGQDGDKTETRTISLATVAAGSEATSQGYALPDASGDYAVPEVTGDSPAYGSAAKPVTTAPAAIATPAHANGTVGDVTRTLTSTQVYTVTSCAASVINCPARYTQKVVTSTVIESTYVCPATETGAVPAMTTSTHKAPVPVTTITDTLTTVVPCKTRTTKTFQPPTTPPPAPTVTIVESTTYCPESGKSTKTGNSEVPVVTTGVPSKEVPNPPAPTTEAQEKPTHSVPTPEKPTGDKPVLPPVATVPYPPHGNGTVPTPVPVVPSSYVPPVVSTPVAQPPHSVVPPPVEVPPVVSTPAVVPPPAAGTPPPTVPTPAVPVPVSGGSVVRTGLMLAVPAVIAVFM
ncbi:hypothetical protein FLONG3_6439 [Fusarium longipes]|uniref:Uncharacterized protein n=1 Tax=Fusarium longipes TaxID=694270 RepID=A0A395SL01_9HYPO|nr:hypothetical protein FLONG3_6439 [Fusarium longipes]